MPKERIRSKYAENPPDLVVQIGWSPEAEHVNVATLNADDAELHPTPEGNGWFIELDRYGINRMIRALRRARDQAFGRDE